MKNIAPFLISSIILIGCQKAPEVSREAWVEKAYSDWPSFALTNEISFADTTFYDIANSFLVDTGYDTIGVSCKHLFLLFENHFGLKNIELENDFESWKMYPKNRKAEFVTIKNLINQNPQEKIGQYNTLKDRDWIIFNLKTKNKELYPLKIRYTAVKKDERVYAIGWVTNKKDIKEPTFTKIQCYKNMGNYFYIKASENQPHGMSGSPVIDRNGYLVGIVSGQEGNSGIMGSVHYLTTLFDRHGVKYKNNE
ncbi:S1 family peptidase [Marinifilum caeruleilacunae]|uniref:Serine protease n=1 Tax=Marinifilum caeruleilacunae TaxID=2499076 RepID=A0ABX1WU64_9BACT|nr:serine protease [Marinifilum caeruleilacunae]NOU59654.1 serine protease [Marinifilum caeruleilacunae]